MPACVPRRSWQSSMICPMYSLGARIEARMYGSRTSAMRTGSGMSVGLWTGIIEPSVSVTSNSTDGIVAISSRSYSRSRRSRTMSMCSSPRNPQRKPNPSASEVSGSQRQRRVVERELLQRVAQLRVVVVVHREQAAEHHRLDVAVAGQRLLGGVARLGGQRVADAQAA